MSGAQEGTWLDDQAGRLVRPYAVSNGRTRPSAHFDLLTLVMATGSRPNIYLGPDYDQVLNLCGGPISVAEVAAHMRLPAVITKVLLSDLVQHEALTTRAPRAVEAASPTDRNLLEAVLHGLRKRL
ncbi:MULTISPECIES: DUF742 domain-containing protein [unclassified Streptomyces]|uniref:DUF742 domain-containing protein n=1 Tax=unclassified Streptomyces TaxID=2593676 RepID=UPI002DD9B7C0|nr:MULTISPECIES: DUF742 domain-containing protein [unclassified Streptomyces]WRZ25214.1 DUF742 domain-containing protein [Streptomyces sp. NBC_00243]WTB43783.1 DUF742 domain-containing protein [Streptomyces sp. NBC_00827]WUC08467.1 DUF742 domain-containing protein [Streptomyces sp. NBC_00564]